MQKRDGIVRSDDDPKMNGVVRTPTEMAVDFVSRAFSDSKILTRIVVMVFVLFPISYFAIDKLEDAGVIPSIKRESLKILVSNHEMLDRHHRAMSFEAERNTFIKLAECSNNAAALAGENQVMRSNGVALCMSSMERNFPNMAASSIPPEMKRRLDEMMKPQPE